MRKETAAQSGPPANPTSSLTATEAPVSAQPSVTPKVDVSKIYADTIPREASAVPESTEPRTKTQPSLITKKNLLIVGASVVLVAAAATLLTRNGSLPIGNLGIGNGK